MLDGLLERLETTDLLRFTTAGSVDDGKSTLIGRLLHDCRAVYEDHWAAVTEASRRSGQDEVDLALLTDGLRAEREQRITIDVAYRPFATARRRFIIADAPGHEQYTRNMVTAASTASLAVILLDAQRGVTVQSKRHGAIATLLGIRHIIVAVNKMDLVGWSEAVYERLKAEYSACLEGRGATLAFVPVSALLGDNVVRPSEHMPWYRGPTLLERLEAAPNETTTDDAFRLAVQYVQRPSAEHRGYAGTIASGGVAVGDAVTVWPSGVTTRVTSLTAPSGPAEVATAPQAVSLTLADDLDVGRGHLLAAPERPPWELAEFEATLVWMDPAPLDRDVTYLLKHTTRVVRARCLEVVQRLDPATLAPEPAEGLELNAIGRVRLRALQPLYGDAYVRNRQTGAFILVDPATHQTAAAGLIECPAPARAVRPPAHLTRHAGRVALADRERLLGQRPLTLWLTGLSGAGKSTVAYAVEERLVRAGHACVVLDGDNLRHGLNRDLGFSPEDRGENIRRVAEVARLFNEAGLIVITSFISPYAADRENARAIIGPDRFVETYVAAPLEECERRDPKGLYAKARAGLIPDFTGVSAPYEAPAAPQLALDTVAESVPALVERVMEYLARRGALDRGESEPC